MIERRVNKGNRFLNSPKVRETRKSTVDIYIKMRNMGKGGANQKLQVTKAEASQRTCESAPSIPCLHPPAVLPA